MRELTRRDALAGATALGAVLIAGCVADDDDPDETDPDDDGNAGQDPDSELELVGTDLVTTAADCGAGDAVEATVTDGDITIEGTVPAPNPCHEAVLETATLTDGALSLGVELEDTTEEDEVCQECAGIVDYEVTLEFSKDLEDLSPFESFTVEHGGNSGETHTIEEADTVVGTTNPAQKDGADDDGPQRGVASHSIETTAAECTNGTLGDEPERIDADDQTEFELTDDTVTVTGSLLASNPCHEASLENVSYDDGVLSVVVGAESVLEDGEYCQECIGAIHYEASVSLVEGTAVSDVSVTHVQTGPESRVDSRRP